MSERFGSPLLPALVAALLVQVAASQAAAAAPAADPLDLEIARLEDLLHGPATAGPTWEETRTSGLAGLARVEEARLAGRWLLASQRLAAVEAELAIASYVNKRQVAELADPAAFETEWRRMGGALAPELEAPAPTTFEGVEPAAIRAMAEAVAFKAGVYYRASRDYARSTTPDAGFYYLGAVEAHREVAGKLRELSRQAPEAPRLRPLGPELDALEAHLLAAYRPPASIDRHPEFIAASSLLKEARELDAAGLRFGALLRFLQAAQAAGQLGAVAPLSDEALAAELRRFASRLEAGPVGSPVDHSLGRLFLERAQDELANPPAAGSLAVALAIAAEVLPRYFAALEPAPARAPSPEAQVTVTLVRWPYT